MLLRVGADKINTEDVIKVYGYVEHFSLETHLENIFERAWQT